MPFLAPSDTRDRNNVGGSGCLLQEVRRGLDAGAILEFDRDEVALFGGERHDPRPTARPVIRRSISRDHNLVAERQISGSHTVRMPQTRRCWLSRYATAGVRLRIELLSGSGAWKMERVESSGVDPARLRREARVLAAGGDVAERSGCIAWRSMRVMLRRRLASRFFLSTRDGCRRLRRCIGWLMSAETRWERWGSGRCLSVRIVLPTQNGRMHGLATVASSRATCIAVTCLYVGVILRARRCGSREPTSRVIWLEPERSHGSAG